MVELFKEQQANQKSPTTSDNGDAEQSPVIVVDSTGVASAHDSTNSGVEFGRIKTPPVCRVPELKMEANSSEELKALCFPPLPTGEKIVVVDSEESTDHVSPSPSSGEAPGKHVETSANGNRFSKGMLQSQTSALLNAKVFSMKTSRQGRSTQRWATDPKTNHAIRLVTGCVPIMKDGRILFVTASRKNEWILPKGGWEMDEAMEESAIRETFEEAGVLGTLGPRLSPVEYETRKARKRRLELEEMYTKSKKVRSETDFPSSASDQIHSYEDENNASEKVAVSLPEAVAPTHAALKTEPCDRQVVSDETSSLASDSSCTYSFVRMSLFPLYVSEVKDAWPECGRFRKVVDIDDAIEMLGSRPEFRAALQEVKEKGLHLV